MPLTVASSCQVVWISLRTRIGFLSVIPRVLLLSWSIGVCEASGDQTLDELAEESGRPASEEATRAIDQMITEGLHHRGANALPRTTDEKFARRIYLDVIGRIPTYAEVKSFLDSTDPQKRARYDQTRRA